MINMKKVTKIQQELMVQFFELNPQMVNGGGGFLKNRSLWEDLTRILNDCGSGPSKTTSKWMKTWLDWRKGTMKKDSSRIRVTTDLDNRVLTLLDKVPRDRSKATEALVSEKFSNSPESTQFDIQYYDDATEDYNDSMLADENTAEPLEETQRPTDSDDPMKIASNALAATSFSTEKGVAALSRIAVALERSAAAAEVRNKIESERNLIFSTAVSTLSEIFK